MSRDQKLSWEFEASTVSLMAIILLFFVSGQEVTNLAELPDVGPFKLRASNDTIHYEADLVINCTGPLKVNSEAYSDGLGTVGIIYNNKGISLFIQI